VPRWVLGDPVRLRQVLLNLLDNAVKFTAAGTVRLEVATVEGSTRRLRFAVTDTGIGIPASALGAIFEPFVQADTSTNRRFGGSGLGLAICRHIVELMQGKIEVESTEGEGTRFSFEAELPPAADQSASLSHTNGFSVDAVRLGMHVLVVDDNAVNRLIADRMLQMLGCSTVVLESGREAIERAGRESFDVILMDCSMPEIDGFAATAAIRRLAAPHGAVRIIAMTALALPGDRERCLRAGMDGYVTKPMQLRRLQQALCTRTDGAIEASGAEVGEPGSP
jgi:CheY-like chemotaxis protein